MAYLDALGRISLLASLFCLTSTMFHRELFSTHANPLDVSEIRIHE